jgi:CRP/FNR family transcriptional regulator, cyclic AMP receptor protein
MSPDRLLSALHAHPWIQGFTRQYIETLASVAEEVHFRPGQTIFREGDASDNFYFIIGGNVRLESRVDGSAVTVQVVGSGEEIGWSAMMEGGVRRFTAKADRDVYAIALSSAKLLEACERNASFGFVLMKHLLFVVAERLDATRLQLIHALHHV